MSVEQEPLIVAAGLGKRGRQAFPREHPGEHFVGDRLGVDGDAVTVEDYKLVHEDRTLYVPAHILRRGFRSEYLSADQSQPPVPFTR
jgi:hypothetical protein